MSTSPFLLWRASLLALLFSAACVPYAGNFSVNTSPVPIKAPFLPLDPGAAHIDTLHFSVSAYGEREAEHIGKEAELSYNRIMLDTNLMTFQSGLFHIIVYGSDQEYLQKTKQPPWSGGVTLGNAIYSFNSPELEQTIAHEMTHVIFYEYMERMDSQQRWVNEGLAVYQQLKAAKDEGFVGDYFQNVRQAMIQNPISMKEMIGIVPATEKARAVSIWYCEANSMLDFMIRKGGRIGFSIFIRDLRKKDDFDAAISDAFPQWSSLDSFYQDWRASLGQ